MKDLTGVLPVLATPFSRDEAVDTAALRDLVDWQYRSGAHGVTVAMVSEVLRLSDAEREHVVETVIEANANRGPVIVSVGAEATRTAADRARHAERAGAAAVMAIPPTTVALSEAELRAYFLTIADATQCPLIVQDASGYVGKPLSIELQASIMAERGSDTIAFKPEAPPLGQRTSALLTATDNEASIFEGSGGLALLDTHPRGVVGTMPGPDITWAIARLWSALETDDIDTAEAVHEVALAMLSLVPGLDGYIALQKHLLTEQGVIPCAISRAPNAYTLDTETTKRINRMFARLRTVCGSDTAASASKST